MSCRGRQSAAIGSRAGRFFIVLLLLSFVLPVRVFAGIPVSNPALEQDLRQTIAFMAASGDRSTGSEGNQQAADYITKRLQAAQPAELDRLEFLVPMLDAGESSLQLKKNRATIPLTPLFYNAITPENLPKQGISGPLIYGGHGELADLNGKQVQDAIVLLEFDSGRNWINLASLGAAALIYINRNEPGRTGFLEKEELSPVQFPCFFLPAEQLSSLGIEPEKLGDNGQSVQVTVRSSVEWRQKRAANIYALFPGTDATRKGELITVEAFYDSSRFMPAASPGADEALSISGLLALADYLHDNPPIRPFLLIASNAHGQEQAGMRETIWAINARSKDLRKLQKELKATRKQRRAWLAVLEEFSNGVTLTEEQGRMLQSALNHALKLEVDRISTLLMQLRMDADRAGASSGKDERITRLAEQRLLLRRISWRSSFDDLSKQEKTLLEPLLLRAVKMHRAVLKEVKNQKRMLKSAKRLRSLITDYEPRAMISLHLSSHGSGLGAFHQGFLYPLRPTINRTAAFREIDGALEEAAAAAYHAPSFVSALRPNRLQPWQDLLPDKPKMAGEVTTLAGLPGFTLATTGDLRYRWGTPWDIAKNINWQQATEQVQLALELIQGVDRAATLSQGYIRNGFSTVSGKTSLLLHGELFAEHPATGTVLLAFQGPARYHLITDLQGQFLLKGVADKKHVQDKVILEGYKFSAKDGSVILAVDKKKTGKSAYRVKMRRQSMKTDLVMFNCRQTTVFNLLEPRSLHYMTKMQLLDGRREAPPVRYWYSRIDTRFSTIASIFLESGSMLKLTLSDTVLKKKMILTGGGLESGKGQQSKNTKNSMGSGYRVDDYPALYHTNLLAARDMWTLLIPRIANLERHGIVDQRISELEKDGLQALERAESSLKQLNYQVFNEEASRSWALAARVYDHVEDTQKDVLFGVLFYIALFVPFAFCLERLLFGFVSIYKRIVAFSGILALLIVVIAQVHPAFELAYSPTVVILAFFIIGLSALVTMIIVVRFEDEMILLQRRASHKRPAEISSWKAFSAAFFLGVSNLRRRKLRTSLTCLTLIILTFTIMSFTSVKSMRRQNRLQFGTDASYQGLMIKNIDWTKLPADALPVFQSLFDGKADVAPRVWLSSDNPARAGHIVARFRGEEIVLQGLIGLSADEPAVTGLDTILVRGRWFKRGEKNRVLIPASLAARLQIDPDDPEQNTLDLWGLKLVVIGVFSEKQLQQQPELDGEPLTPVIFPTESGTEMSDVEKDALESGEDVRNFQGRYHHLAEDTILIMPAATLMELGGTLQAVAIKPPGSNDGSQARLLSDRFGLAMFSGEEEGVFLYNAGDTMSYSGMPTIVIPLLISILIVLNTMISSVFERKREIAVYTSVGLAPSHVSFLFIAEALAFAVLSVVLGYLVAQTSAGFLAGTKLWSGITVNYSSTAGVAAMVLVMGVVLLSVIYPSRVAANIAIPDVNQSWKLPDTVDNLISVTLPFLMRFHEHASICGFLYSYFEEYQDVSHGIFSTGRVKLDEQCRVQAGDDRPGAADCVHLQAEVWLAPFDFGIRQVVDIQFCQAREGEDFLEITVMMTRKSGEMTMWRRINTAFLHVLRKQLLVWRSLDENGQQEYAVVLNRVLQDRNRGDGEQQVHLEDG
jgi:hypothetical protein